MLVLVVKIFSDHKKMVDMKSRLETCHCII